MDGRMDQKTDRPKTIVAIQPLRAEASKNLVSIGVNHPLLHALAVYMSLGLVPGDKTNKPAGRLLLHPSKCPTQEAKLLVSIDRTPISNGNYSHSVLMKIGPDNTDNRVILIK